MSSQNIRAKRLVLTASLALCALPTNGVAETPLELSDEGLGGITAATPFDIPTLRETVPSVVWTRDVRETEDGSKTVFLASSQGTIVFSVHGDGRGRIARIEIDSPLVWNRLGPRVGDTFQSTRESEQLGTCWSGMEAQSGSVVCEAAQTERIGYLFSGRWNGPDGQIPPAFILNAWTISQVMWVPHRFAGMGKPVQSPHTGPTFDCTKAQGSIEELICGSAELAHLDRQLNTAYAVRLAAVTSAEKRNLRAEQRGWIKGRNECWKSSDPYQCTVGTYTDRIAELSMDHTSLPGTAWVGIRIAGDTVPSDVDINLSFGEDGRLTGSSGCNRFFSTYNLDARDMKIDHIGGTRRMCPKIQMLAERRFLEALERVDGWATRNDNLILFGRGAELTFERM